MAPALLEMSREADPEGILAGGIKETRDDRALRRLAGVLQEAIIYQQVRSEEPGLDALLAKLLRETADVIRLSDEENCVWLGVFDRRDLVTDVGSTGFEKQFLHRRAAHASGEVHERMDSEPSEPVTRAQDGDPLATEFVHDQLGQLGLFDSMIGQDPN